MSHKPKVAKILKIFSQQSAGCLPLYREFVHKTAARRKTGRTNAGRKSHLATGPRRFEGTTPQASGSWPARNVFVPPATLRASLWTQARSQTRPDPRMYRRRSYGPCDKARGCRIEAAPSETLQGCFAFNVLPVCVLSVARSSQGQKRWIGAVFLQSE